MTNYVPMPKAKLHGHGQYGLDKVFRGGEMEVEGFPSMTL